MVAVAGDSSELGELAATIEAVAGAFTDAWMVPQNAPDVPVPATQLRVLFIVAQRGGVNLSGLAAELGALLSSASRLCDRLEAAGLIVRDPGQQSRREITIRLSPDGLALLDRMRQHRQAELLRVLADMAPAARAALVAGLTGFHAAAHGTPADAAVRDGTTTDRRATSRRTTDGTAVDRAAAGRTAVDGTAAGRKTPADGTGEDGQTESLPVPA